MRTNSIAKDVGSVVKRAKDMSVNELMNCTVVCTSQ